MILSTSDYKYLTLIISTSQVIIVKYYYIWFASTSQVIIYEYESIPRYKYLTLIISDYSQILLYLVCKYESYDWLGRSSAKRPIMC